MPLFDYSGQLQSGQNFQGTLEADSQHHADAVLTDMGVRVLTLRPAKRFGYVAPLSLDDFRYMNDQIATITSAGVPLEPGLRAMASETGSRRLKATLTELADSLAAGVSLDDALRRQESRFPASYAGTIAAGIRSGDLGGTLYAVSSHLRLKGEVRRAM
ncbi:MAG: type II secretion system F family protein, partial [Phycisphaerae bacterium]